MREVDLTASLVAHLLPIVDEIQTEVSNMGQSIDVVFLKDSKYTAIEVKLSNWKQALRQCKAHELVADYIAIAISTKTISKMFYDISKKSGYGIYHYCNNEWRIVLKPVSVSRNWKPQKEIFAKHFASLSGKRMYV